MLFETISVVHLLVWSFILFAFIDVRTASFNLYYFIPLLYLLHIMPIHVLIEAKKQLRPATWQQDDNVIRHQLVIGSMYDYCLKYFDNATYNPLSPQGMLVLGAILSAWSLRLQ